MLITELNKIGKECLAMTRLPDDVDIEYFNINDPDNAPLKMMVRTELLDQGFSIYGDHWMIVEDKSGSYFLAWVRQSLLKRHEKTALIQKGWDLECAELVHTSEQDEDESAYVTRIEKKMHMAEDKIYNALFHHVRSFEEKINGSDMVVVFLNERQFGGEKNELNRVKNICVGILKKKNI